MNTAPTPPRTHSGTGTFEVRVRGHLDPPWADRLGVPSLVHESDGTTTLGGIGADQAVLHGLLRRVRDLSLPLVSVLFIDPERSP